MAISDKEGYSISIDDLIKDIDGAVIRASPLFAILKGSDADKLRLLNEAEPSVLSNFTIYSLDIQRGATFADDRYVLYQRVKCSRIPRGLRLGTGRLHQLIRKKN